MAHIVTAPEKVPFAWNYVNIFLAGGISNCDDWQKTVSERFVKELPDNVVIANPRRSGTLDPSHEPSAREQITWEYQAIQDSAFILFWFPPGGPNPIALFELGKELVKSKANGTFQNLFIGAHPDNARVLDIHIQSDLMGYDYPIFQDLDSLMDAVITQF